MLRPRHRPVPPGRPPPALPAAIPPRPVAALRAGADDFGRERQLRDFRRANGLCFKCGDRYSREHQCKRQGQLLTIQVGEFGSCYWKMLSMPWNCSRNRRHLQWHVVCCQHMHWQELNILLPSVYQPGWGIKLCYYCWIQVVLTALLMWSSWQGSMLHQFPSTVFR